MSQTTTAAVIEEWGAAPVTREVPVPEREPGTTLVRLTAASVNPADLAIGAGRFYLPLPTPPFVTGVEAVGEVVESDVHAVGSTVWCLRPTGNWAGLFAAPDATLTPVAPGVPAPTAVAMGVAGLAGWMPVVDRGGLQPGETLVVLGASGAVGQVAIQAGRRAGAGRIVAVARSQPGLERAIRIGADAAVSLLDDDIPGAIRAACPSGADVVVDTLWGPPLVATLPVVSPRGRVVQIGNAAAPTAEITAGPLRGGRIDIRGFSVFSEQHDDLGREYARLLDAAASGDVTLPIETLPLERAAEAWGRQRDGAAGAKLVLIP